MLRGKHMAERHMVDTLQIGTDSGSGYGNSPASSWAYDAENTVKCFVNTSKSREVSDGTHTTVTDAVISVPLGSAITSANRVKVTHRFRTALSAAEIYAVVGAPRNGRASMQLNCRRLTGNSAT